MFTQTQKLKTDGIYIDGKWIESSEYFHNLNPFDNVLINEISNGDSKHVELASKAASAALDSWKNITSKKRNSYIFEFSENLKNNKYELAEIISLEQGKSIDEALGEIEKCFEYINFFTEENLRINNYNIEPYQHNREITIKHEPIGVVAAITPWNLPVGMIIRKIIPALCVGCTIILKPSSETSWSAIKIVEYFSGILPKGVLNLITSNKDVEVGESISKNKNINLLTFTGSSITGKKIIKNSHENVKKLILELGGNAPFIIYKDADLKKAVNDLVETKFRNAGQTCTSVNRLFIHKEIYNEFLKLLIVKVKQLIIKKKDLLEYDIGPLINKKALLKLQEHLQDALNKGARILYGGNLYNNVFEPTIITDIDSHMKVIKEETFGPILPIITFDNSENLIKEVNDNSYGLCAYIYTNNLLEARKLSNYLDYGMIGLNNNRPTQVNTPFGGFKESGYGKESGREGLMEFLRIKSVYLDY